VASLESIDLGLLAGSDLEECQTLLCAAQTKGFFYIELANSEGRAYLELAESLLSWSKEFFQKSLQEKLLETRSDEIESWTAGLHACSLTTHSYKPIAQETGVVLGTKDGFEAYKVLLCPVSDFASCNGDVKIPTNMFIGANRTAPCGCSGLVGDSKIGQAFATRSHEISNMILASLSRSLGLDGDAGFADRHRFGVPSSSATVVNCYPLQLLPEGSSAGHNAHTDLGSITLLFCSTWGLQVYSAESATWSYVEPVRGRAIVNIGDTLRFLSGNTLQSCLHRVVRHSQWSGQHRLSLAYFARPNSKTMLVDGQGCEWSVEKWVARKFRSYKESHEQQDMNGVQFGGL
ncbi:2OG-Fe(II) oxygenase family oxidoreductase, partial [Pyrenochaeta sp. MPI-SDFR-AT-0127]